MKPLCHLILLATALILASGCNQKALEEQVAACEAENVQLQTQIEDWVERFDRESTRWTEMESTITEALPKALGEFHEERERIVAMVPEQVRGEVEGYLSDYFTTVMTGFEFLQKDNTDIKLQLEATNKVLSGLRTDTNSIGYAVDEALVEERYRRDALRTRVDAVSQNLNDVIELISEFDKAHINCKTCPQRLKFNRKQREAVLTFHQELMVDLANLKDAPTSPLPDSATSDDDESEGSGSEGL
jgi:chromosome segregation ATPase